MKVFFELSFDSGYYFGMAVAQVAYANAGDQIGISFTVWRIQVNSFRTLNGDEVGIGCSLRQVVQEYFFTEFHGRKDSGVLPLWAMPWSIKTENPGVAGDSVRNLIKP